MAILFPNGIDNITQVADVTAGDMPNINTYQTKLENGESPTSLAEFLQTSGLSNKIINAARWNELRDIILAMEQYCQDGITTQYNAVGYEGAFSSIRGDGYKKNNMVLWRDKIYIAVQDVPGYRFPLSFVPNPSNTTYWRVLSISAGGLYSDYRGTWSSSENYNVNDLVSYKPSDEGISLYICILANTGSYTPSLSPTYWKPLIKSISPSQYQLLSRDPPSTSTDGTIYFQTVDYQ